MAGAYDAFSLGLGDPVPLSAEHGVRSRESGKTIWVRLTPDSSARGDDEIADSFADIDWLAELAEIDGPPTDGRRSVS